MSVSKKYKDVRKIISHYNCADGTASALILMDAFHEAGQDIEEVRFVAYDTPEHENIKAEPGLLFVDFSPPVARIQEFVDAGTFMVDHHKSMAPYAPLFGDRAVFEDETPGVSGAVLAWREADTHIAKYDTYPLSNRSVFSRDLVEQIGIRDTWVKSDPEAFEKASALSDALKFIPTPLFFEVRDGKTVLAQRLEYVKTLIEGLSPILKVKHRESVDYAKKSAFFFTTPRGTKVGVINSTTLTSDVVGELPVDILVGFSYHGANNKLGLSFRSRHGYDVGSLAVSLGGGGHKAAAGGSLPIYTDRSPYQSIREMLCAWENSEAFSQTIKASESKP